jgi:uncharacterized membrane protein
MGMTVMIPRTKIFVILAFCLVEFSACRHETDLSSFPEVSFSANVQAIIIGNCTQSGCHTNQGNDHHEFPLVTYEDISGYVSAGNADNSKLFEAIIGRTKVMPPPPQSMLTDEQIKYIYLWIEQGAKNN